MIKICFICLGNICRSPMAEFILKDKIKNNNLNNIVVDSKAISYEEQGNDMYYKAKEVLDKHNISYTSRAATRLEKSDLDKYDYFYYMEDYILEKIENIIGKSNKIVKLLSIDIEDPWYSNNFEDVYQLIDKGCNRIIDELKNRA